MLFVNDDGSSPPPPTPVRPLLRWTIDPAHLLIRTGTYYHNNMDTAPMLASWLGVSLPKAHRELDKIGAPKSSPGVPREVPQGAYAAISDAIGAAPVVPTGLTREAVLVLAAIAGEPLGSVSSRAIAARAGISPSTASKLVHQLAREGLIKQRSRMEARGTAQLVTRWHLTSFKVWPPEVVDAVKKARLPKPKYQVARGRLPSRFHHLFWSVDPNKLRLPDDAEYVAHQMLTSDSFEAIRWALTSLPESAIDRALAIRGVDARTRSLAQLAVQHG